MKINIKSFLIVLFVLIYSLNSHSQIDWKQIKTSKDLVENYPEVVKNLFNEFNLDYLGLEKVKASYEKGSLVEACNRLLAYYKTSSTGQKLRRVQPVKTDRTNAYADTILQNIFTIQNVKGQVPWGKDGHRDWYYTGPNQDKEWAYLSNRHEQLDSVFVAYHNTGNPKYLNYLDLFLRDFIIKSQPYPAKKTWGAIWRGLEVSFRSKEWTRIFYGLINNKQISPATQLLMLSSLPDHADYNRNYHMKHGNWLTMELSALAEVGAKFPEFKKSDEWLNYAIKQMTQSIKSQVYLDGVQNELSAHYHYVAWNNFEEFKTTCELAGKKLPKVFTQTLEKMIDYTAKSMRPDGFGPLNNDSDLDYNRDVILKKAKIYGRPDWEFIATNGEKGIAPEGGSSFFYPWAGQMISRSNYNINAHWSFFDVGPWGAGHEHNDKLHLSVSAYGTDLLVDSGRFAYTGEVAKKFRAYAIGSEGHNTVVIDHFGQSAGPSVVSESLDNSAYKITEAYDFATNSFDKYKSIEGVVKHQRSLLYVRGDFWVVVDRIITDRPRHIETLWHWHPDCNVEKNKSVVRTNNVNGNLAIIPVGKHNFKIKIVKGQEKPNIQGWYSPMYNMFTPNSTSIYSVDINTSATFVWILQPSKNKASLLKAKIISENENAIKIKVKSKNVTYKLEIPYYNSNDLNLEKKVN
ncbi:alginate lyase family protein [Aureibaculum sp. A20]|uniref:Alginate lyase family protein n=1 Tax=Aureibaculum flavum TaxID=2795986 RepID=A0ABS0WVU2_9FLAO|nr:alginate lyase family protein [Aureibaculum flavum]MBJ2176063.1 alginate lyase family protein [Aureibaculum flavum]